MLCWFIFQQIKNAHCKFASKTNGVYFNLQAFPELPANEKSTRSFRDHNQEWYLNQQPLPDRLAGATGEATLRSLLLQCKRRLR